MSDEAWREFREEVRRDSNNCFDRLRRLETKAAIGDEKDKNLIEKMDKLYDFFEKHDEHEMKKYDTMADGISELRKLFYVASGVGAVILFMGMDGLKALFGIG